MQTQRLHARKQRPHGVPAASIGVRRLRPRRGCALIRLRVALLDKDYFCGLTPEKGREAFRRQKEQVLCAASDDGRARLARQTAVPDRGRRHAIRALAICGAHWIRSAGRGRERS